MHDLHSIDLDFKLLLIFQTLMKTRKVSEVGDLLGMSQPTISRGLSRLREHFGDQLFVRTQRSMEPTPYAQEIAPIVDDMLDLYYSRLSQRHEFDPMLSRRTFKIAASEIGHLLVLPELVNTLGGIAPSVHLEGVPLGMGSLIEDLETGQVDIAFGGYPKLYAGIHERTVGNERYVCVVRKDHPDIGRKLSLKAFLEADHVVASARGLGHIHESIEKQIMEICPQDRVRVICHSFLTSIMLSDRTDLIATLPSRVAMLLEDKFDFKILEPPFELPTFDIKLYWHERFHREPANRWLRQTIAEMLAV